MNPQNFYTQVWKTRFNTFYETNKTVLTNFVVASAGLCLISSRVVFWARCQPVSYWPNLQPEQLFAKLRGPCSVFEWPIFAKHFCSDHPRSSWPESLSLASLRVGLAGAKFFMNSRRFLPTKSESKNKFS